MKGGEGGGAQTTSCVNWLGKTLFPTCCVVFNKTNVILPQLLASLFLQFEKFYVKLSVCFCLISVKVSEFIYFEIYFRKQLKRTQKKYTVWLYHTEFLLNSTENIIYMYKMSWNICIRLCAWFTQMSLWCIRLDWFSFMKTDFLL